MPGLCNVTHDIVESFICKGWINNILGQEKIHIREFHPVMPLHNAVPGNLFLKTFLSANSSI